MAENNLGASDTPTPSLNGGARRGRKRGTVDRDRLLDSAASMFASKGYRATSLDDIAGALGIKKSSLYHYIGSKEEILVDLYDRIYEIVEAKVDAIAADELQPDEKLRRMVFTYIESITTHTDMFAMALRNEHELSPEQRLAVLRRHRRMERVFEAVIVEGQNSGLLVNLTPRLMGLAMFGMLLFVQYWYKNAGYTSQQITSELTTLLETGWRATDKPLRKAWPRAESVSEALQPARGLLKQMERDVAAFKTLLDLTEDSLVEGLARAASATALESDGKRRPRPGPRKRG